MEKQYRTKFKHKKKFNRFSRNTRNQETFMQTNFKTEGAEHTQAVSIILNVGMGAKPSKLCMSLWNKLSLHNSLLSGGTLAFQNLRPCCTTGRNYPSWCPWWIVHTMNIFRTKHSDESKEKNLIFFNSNAPPKLSQPRRSPIYPTSKFYFVFISYTHDHWVPPRVLVYGPRISKKKII